MRGDEYSVFVLLFKEACAKCFGTPLTKPLTEPESRRLSDVILEQSGLVVGWKSLKNYSVFVLDRKSAREENPSIATLDTLARYVLNSPKSDEAARQNQDQHFPFWFQYRETRHEGSPPAKGRRWLFIAASLMLACLIFVVLRLFVLAPRTAETFEENFHTLNDDSLALRGWGVSHKDGDAWSRRDASPGHLTLYTLQGDNWPDSNHAPDVRNLLYRKLSGECFAVEAHLLHFVPKANWEQAGLLLMEDTAFAGKSVRFSIAFNNYLGGFPGPGEIHLQAITCQGKQSEKPEEVVHTTVFTLNNETDKLVEENLKYSALRIEKEGKVLRFLYSAGPMENAAFKEVGRHEFSFEPRYVALVALRGFVKDTTSIPAVFSLFRFVPMPCGS